VKEERLLPTIIEVVGKVGGAVDRIKVAQVEMIRKLATELEK